MPDCPPFGQSDNRMNKNADAGPVRYWNMGPSPVTECSGTGMRCWMPECCNAGGIGLDASAQLWKIEGKITKFVNDNACFPYSCYLQYFATSTYFEPRMYVYCTMMYTVHLCLDLIIQWLTVFKYSGTLSWGEIMLIFRENAKNFCMLPSPPINRMNRVKKDSGFNMGNYSITGFFILFHIH